MEKYIIISRFLPTADVRSLPERSSRVHDALAAIDPDFLDRWLCEYLIVGGSIDVIDVVESDDEEEVRSMAAAIAAHGECKTEIARAIPWREFIESMPERGAAASSTERRES